MSKEESDQARSAELALLQEPWEGFISIVGAGSIACAQERTKAGK
jgi:hypothetical protein